MRFQPGFVAPSTIDDADLWFVFNKGRMLFKTIDGTLQVPATRDLGRCRQQLTGRQYIGDLDGRHCFAADVPEAGLDGNALAYKELRTIFNAVDEELVWAAGRANQLATWSRNHQYCGHCGAACRDKADERAKICPACNLINYPRLSPAVIVAVVRDDRILLARNRRFRLPFYSVLAGFVEPGETLEACVLREIDEEVGISVDNLRYFGSQPWPFPDSLMIAFLADYAGGEIRVDGSEITEARWFKKDQLPRIPPPISIARQLIDWFAS